MSRVLLTLFLVLASLPAVAGPYLFDLLKVPSFRSAWDSAFRNQPRPAWVKVFEKTSNGVTAPKA